MAWNTDVSDYIGFESNGQMDLRHTCNTCKRQNNKQTYIENKMMLYINNASCTSPHIWLADGDSLICCMVMMERQIA